MSQKKNAEALEGSHDKLRRELNQGNISKKNTTRAHFINHKIFIKTS